MIRLSIQRAVLLLIAAMLLGACSTRPPEGITPVSPFDIQRYSGKWYEIARMDHAFERGLSDVSAQYRIQPDASVEVINRGYDSSKQAWKQTIGRAVFTGSPQRAALKVSFFGPFYGAYNVVVLDPDYRWALVIGPSRDYVWILARDKQLSAAVRAQLIEQARALGVDTAKFIWVSHTRSEA